MRCNRYNNTQWLHPHPKAVHCPMNCNLIDNTQWSHPHPKFYVVAISDITCVEEPQRRTSDVDMTIWCYLGNYSSKDNVELWTLMQSLGVIVVITDHATTQFLCPFLFETIFFAHTCLPPFFNY